jgi:sterol desaturase/sphingolipid hydroxylase (fatty acid hydroxylase superfamily)
MSLPLLLSSVVFLVLCAGVFGPLQALHPYRGQRQSRRMILICCGLFLLNQQYINLLVSPLVAMAPWWWLRLVAPGSVLAFAGHLVLALVLIDLAEYSLHRAMHASPLLWRFHRLHHEPELVTWQVAWYQHPVDALLHALAAGMIGVLLGIDLSAIISLVLLRKLWTSFLHADVDLHFGWLARIFATPAFHRLHHDPDPRCYNRNFSATFPLWDHLCGTWMEIPEPRQNKSMDSVGDAAESSRSAA